MSINSLQNRMEQRAASMAQMAQHASNPNEIMSIQQRLVSEVQNGTIKPYVGIPLIQELTKQLEKAKAQAAMGAMGAPVQGQGMAPTPPQVPIAQQVMEQATQSQGVEALPSNLPQDYAGGGIIAFEDGGPVQHLDGGGSPISRWWEDYTKKSNEVRQAENLRNKLQMKYGPASDVQGFFMNQTDAERQTAKDITGRLGSLTLPQMQALYEKGPSALPPVASAPSAAPPATPAAPPVSSDAIPYDPRSATLRKDYEPSVGLPSLVQPVATNFKPPAMPAFNLPKSPELFDYQNVIKDLPSTIKAASETAVNNKKKELEDIDDPLFKAREEKLFAREGQLGKDAEISRLLSIMKGGLKAAAGKSPIALINIAEGGEEGVSDLIKGEAARRAAKDKLDDYRDNLTMQKSAAKKGNIAAADAAGARASEDIRASKNLELTGAHYGNSEALQKTQLEQSGVIAKGQHDIGIAGLGMQAQQLNLQGQGLNLQAQGLAQNALHQQNLLASQDRRYASMDKASQARMQQVTASALNNFMVNSAPPLIAQLTSKYGKNWKVGKDPLSLEAQTIFNQARNSYLITARGEHEDVMNSRSADSLLNQGQ